MAKINYRKIPGKLTAAAALVSLLGITAATITINEIASHEGYVPEAYQDPVGIWTKCFGDTNNVIKGKKYTFDECLASLNSQVLAHAKPVIKCVPGLEKQAPKVKAAMISMAYNIGTNAFCKSSVATHANKGEWKKACMRIAEIYKTAKGKELSGLVKRRKAESLMCLDGLENGHSLDELIRIEW